MKKTAFICLALACVLNGPLSVAAAWEDGNVQPNTTAGSDSTVSTTLSTEPALFSVTVPTQLTMNVKSDGTTETGNAVITNNSQGPVKITNVTVTGKNDWKLIDFTKDMKQTPVDTKEFGLQLNTVGTTEAGYAFNAANFTVMDAKNDTNSDECPLTFAGKVAPQSKASSNLVVAEVVFTIDWNKA